MITKKITKKMEDRFLKLIYRRYIDRFGYGTRNLSEYRLLLTDDESFVTDMPEIAEFDSERNLTRYRVTDILIELKAKEYIEFSHDNLHYWLSVRGYEYASKNGFERFVDYMNNNSGWALPISFLSFIVSVFALFIKS